jgi:MscS family membrane protein
LGVTATSDEARRAARQLWSALNRIRLVDPAELPDATDLDADDSVFVYFPRPFNAVDEAIRSQVTIGDHVIAFARQPNGRWLFSAETMAGIGELSAALSALPPQVRVDEESLQAPAWVLAVVPASLRTGVFLGVRYWQWLGLLALIFAGVFADYVARAILRPILGRLLSGLRVEIDGNVMDDVIRAAGLLAAATVWQVLLPALALVDAVHSVARSAVGVFAVLAATLTAWRFTDMIGEVLLAKSRKTESKFDDILVPLLRKTAKLFVLAFGVVYGAQYMNINIVPLLTGLGIGGLAFAFAAKDTIENLFGSVAVVLDRPFEVGDWIVIGDIEGTIEELGFRSTRIRTFYNSLVTMPNAALVRATVDNYGRRQYRRWKTTLGVQYDTSPEKLLAFTEGIRELVRRHPYTRKDYFQVWAHGFSDSSIDVLVYVFHEVPDWSTELRERERLLLDIVRLADKLGVQFAFPTQTLHLYKEEHQPPQSQYQVPRGQNDQQAMRAGALAAQEIVKDQPWRKEKPMPVDYGGVNAGEFDGGGE